MTLDTTITPDDISGTGLHFGLNGLALCGDEGEITHDPFKVTCEACKESALAISDAWSEFRVAAALLEIKKAAQSFGKLLAASDAFTTVKINK